MGVLLGSFALGCCAQCHGMSCAERHTFLLLLMLLRGLEVRALTHKVELRVYARRSGTLGAWVKFFLRGLLAAGATCTCLTFRRH